jgi:subtilase family serine protease
MHRPDRLKSSPRRGVLVGVEGLEARTLLSVSWHPHQFPRVTHAPAVSPIRGSAEPLLAVNPQDSGGPTGLSPAEIRSIYGFNLLTQTGSGQTIYIIDAYDDPTIASDLKAFDAQFGLPAPSFTKVEPEGRPATNANWALEISLDVEWAHAIAPNAAIDLVEAATNSNANLYGAINWAVNNGAHIVSMSWGTGEASSELSLDSNFEKSGVTFLASAGDSGGDVTYPSASPYVVSVGGTTLNLSSSGTLISETAWSSGGGGVSQYEAEPAYQTNFGLNLGGRGTPDVSYDANPSSGVAVYDSTPYGGESGWFQVGGTSAGAPQWAGLVALADQGRTTPLSSTNLTRSPIYNAAVGTLYALNYRDITSGSNGYPAGVGYDLATGLGSPLANNLVPWLTVKG